MNCDEFKLSTTYPGKAEIICAPTYSFELDYTTPSSCTFTYNYSFGKESIGSYVNLPVTADVAYGRLNLEAKDGKCEAKFKSIF